MHLVISDIVIIPIIPIIIIIIIIIITIIIITLFLATIIHNIKTYFTAMLAVKASCFSLSDMWRKPKDEKTKERQIVGSWRERRVPQESGEVKGISGNWRVGKPKKAPEADESKAYGGSMPPESTLIGMYKHFKVDNAEFTTWLVESVYPSLERLPFYITLSDKQAKGECEASRSVSDIEPSTYHR